MTKLYNQTSDKRLWYTKLCTFICMVVWFAVHPVQASDTTRTPLVYRFSIEEGIFAPALRVFNEAMDEADSLGADIILLRLDTYGGAVDVADEMRTRLLTTKAKTVVYILNNAASAGALISVACDSIYMAREATIGAAVVVDQGGDAAAEKYQSYFREKFRATAQAKGRNPDIAEAMVNPDVVIEGVIDSGKILTFTAQDALANDFCDKIVTGEEEIWEHLGISTPQIVDYEPSFIDGIIRFFTEPVVSGLLLTVIFFGIFFELQSPGVGFPLIAAITAAVLYFTPLYLDGLAENWEVLLFLVGLVLIAVELFVIPGFGITGISGLVLVFTGLILSLVRNVSFDFTFTTTGDISRSFGIVISAIVATILLLIAVGSRLGRSPLTRALIFTDATSKAEGFTTDMFQNRDMRGLTGTALTDLHPAGTVLIDNERFDAVTSGEYIEKGTPIRVLESKGFSVKVEALGAASAQG